MDWMNYHHLLYFWAVAREGSVSRAARALRRSQPTVTAQVQALEEAFGEPLFNRGGRRWSLTEMGRRVHSYAEEIFALGRELQNVVKGRPADRPLPLVVGVALVLPKLVTRRLLEPVLSLPKPVRLVCLEGRPERLMTDLAQQDLDVILSDSPAPADVKVKAYSHLLGESGISFFGPREFTGRPRGFPACLDRAPLLLPPRSTVLRRSLDDWFERRGLHPDVVAEFDDSALLKVFGQTGLGLFAAPTVVEKDVARQYSVRVIGRTREVTERFYAISIDSRLKHPAVAAILHSARQDLFR